MRKGFLATYVSTAGDDVHEPEGACQGGPGAVGCQVFALMSAPACSRRRRASAFIQYNIQFNIQFNTSSTSVQHTVQHVYQSVHFTYVFLCKTYIWGQWFSRPSPHLKEISFFNAKEPSSQLAEFSSPKSEGIPMKNHHFVFMLNWVLN